MFLHFDDRHQWLEQLEKDREGIRENTLRICHRREGSVIAIYASYVRDADEWIVRHRSRVLAEDPERQADELLAELREDATCRGLMVAGGLYQAT